MSHTRKRFFGMLRSIMHPFDKSRTHPSSLGRMPQTAPTRTQARLDWRINSGLRMLERR
jgi:hypothetical protein